MAKFEKIVDNLEYLYQIWTNLADKKARRKINYILPFINSASFLSGLIDVADFADESRVLISARLKKILDNFTQNYADFYQVNLLDVGWTDFSAAEFKQIEAVQKKEIEVDDDLRQKIARRVMKFEHAHSKIALNYALIIKSIAQAATREEKAREALRGALRDQAREVFTQIEEKNCDINKIIEEFHNVLNIEANGDLVPFDNVEDEALLCQISNFRRNISSCLNFLCCVSSTDLPKALHLKENGRIVEKSLFALQKKMREAAVDVALCARKISKANAGIDVRIGFESEFLLRQIDGEAWNLKGEATLNEAVKKSLSDINDRRLVQKQYGAILTIPATRDVGLFLKQIKLQDLPVARRREIRKIWKHLETVLGLKYEGLAELKEKILYFTDAEIYFYKLLLLTKNKLPIDVKPFYHAARTDFENLQEIIPLIMKNLWHANLLDGFRVYEIDIGHFALKDALPQLERVKKKMQQVAQSCGLVLENPNVQINLSFVLAGRNIFMPEIVDKIVYLNRLGVEIVHKVEESVAKAGETPGVLRGQVEIAACFDKKKSIGNELADTPYLEVNSDLSAYAVHRILTGKGESVRVSVFSKKQGVAVVEIRLLGNNPHFATLPEDEIFTPGLEFIPQVLLPLLAQKIAEFIANENEDELKKMLEEKIELLPDGAIRDAQGVAKVASGEAKPEETALKVPVLRAPE